MRGKRSLRRAVPREFRCRDCPSCSSTLPGPVNDALVCIGEYCCTKGRRPRKLKDRNRRGVPDWCPLRKDPCELRIYGFRNADEQALHILLCGGVKRELSPSASRYAVIHEGTSPLSAKEFWRKLETERDAELLGLPVELYSVVEIDDGLKPVCFYKTIDGYEPAPLFDRERAQKDRWEGGTDKLPASSLCGDRKEDHNG